MLAVYFLEHVTFNEFTPNVETHLRDGSLDESEIAIAYSRDKGDTRGIYFATTKDFVSEKYRAKKLNEEDLYKLRNRMREIPSPIAVRGPIGLFF